MEPTIFVLPPKLASQIAAGEVVERPASVVKELIENALDAGASRVDVTIEAGGIRTIEVADDGKGMTAVDARLAIERHATSKLRRMADLDELCSFGFRGEALPSIASVSRLTLRTRSADSDEGLELASEGGSEMTARPAAAPVGTTVRVADLFFNVPARRKFLRSTGTESGHVGEVLLDAALSRPDVTFTLTRDARQVRNWARCADRIERVQQLMSEEELLICRGARGPLDVLALLSRPERARQGAAGLKLLVNGRPIRDRALAGTIAHAYGSVLERGRYPRGVLYLDLPPRLVDVNVHPQKAEVRFADPRAVSDAVHGIIARELGQRLAAAPRAHSNDTLPSPAFPAPTEPLRASPGPRPAPPQRSLLLQDSQRPVTSRPLDMAGTMSSPGAANGDPLPGVLPHLDSLDATTRSRERQRQPTWSEVRFLAQVRETYLICEGRDGLYVLDQHAASERVLFSKLHRQYQEQGVAAQALLFPLVVDVSTEESEILSAHIEQITAMGLDVRVRTHDAVSIHAVPRLLQRSSPERMLRDLMAELTRAGERGFSDAVDKALATMACHAAVRAGDSLSRDEAIALLAALDQADFAAYCPHGRPIVAFTSWEELERKVGRR